MNNIYKILLSKRKKYKEISFKIDVTYHELLNYIANELNRNTDIIGLKNCSDSQRKFIDFAHKARELTAHFDALLMIYNDIDCAKLICADGIILDENSLTISEVKKLAEETLIVGYNSKSFYDTAFAQKSNYDFVTCLKIFSDIEILQFLNS